MVFMNMVDHEIHHDANAPFVGCFDHGVKFLFCPKTWFHFTCLRWPVSVEGRDVMHAISRFSGAVGRRIEGR